LSKIESLPLVSNVQVRVDVCPPTSSAPSAKVIELPETVPAALSFKIILPFTSVIGAPKRNLEFGWSNFSAASLLENFMGASSGGMIIALQQKIRSQIIFFYH
jgi:hypothetical protein